MVTATAPVTPPSTPFSAGERHESASLPISSPERLVYGRKHITPDGVYSLVLNRPREHNALSREMLLQMEEPVPASTALTPSPLRALIVESSSPGKFCAGADLKERKTMTEEQVVAFLQLLRTVFDKVAAFPAPTIAALDGPTLGGGLELAIACDFRVANRTVKRIGFPESGLGIIPGAGGTQRAPRLLGLTKAKELIYTGRSLSATEALEWGLVDYLTDESAPARSLLLAATMSNSAPLALRAAKLSISKGAEMELDDALKWEVQCYEDLLPTQDRREALEAFAEKRKPNFVGA
ncbi:ClpP/crotonase [Microstroma glucosiphilum]|uniref:ClpP/crotonase n=1 Tax=Pseudomicrostroma glucosiphilum TaxID=1684307 RepID=A0A316U163_9BASI|nr:ClpP/crotonase [Pseudomicrostroma glucosiphilum]PWN18213.1 ClpP/crotonase [Pseudomicrostroma glucosiphilum]